MADIEQQAAIFRIGQERFALDIRYIREITRMEEISRVPSMPDFVEGVMELRGQIIPVVDLRKRLDAPVENSRSTRIVITRLERKPLGLIVDEVTDVWQIEEDEIKDAPSVGVSFQPAFMDGVLKRNDQIVFFLAFEQLLSSTEKAKVKTVQKGSKKSSSASKSSKKTATKKAPARKGTKKTAAGKTGTKSGGTQKDGDS